MSWTGQAILIKTYKPGIMPAAIVETDILPNGSDFSAISSVIQQKGRPRKRVRGRIYVSTISDYEDYIDDYVAGTTGSIDFVSGTFMIEDLSDPTYMQGDCIFFECGWIEVS